MWTFICLFPIYWTVTTSFKTAVNVTQGHLIPWLDFQPDWRGWRSLGLSPDTIGQVSTVRDEFTKRITNSAITSVTASSLAIVIGVLRYLETKHFIWIVVLSLSTGMLVATKETSVINLSVMIVAILSAVVWEIARRMRLDGEFHGARLAKKLKASFAGKLSSFDHALSAFIIFIYLHWLHVDGLKTITTFSARFRTRSCA